VIECEGGRVVVPDYNSAKAFDKDGREITRFSGSHSHFENFIRAVRSRRESDLNASIVEGHRSTRLCHMSNISYRVGASEAPAVIREQIKGDKNALATFERMTEHLAANGVDLEKTPATLGAVIKTEAAGKIVGNDQALTLLRRTPRSGYEIKVTA